jgi:SAM-dependent methyltransferase
MIRFVPKNANTVLDVGCNTGAFGDLLKQTRPCEVWGVEPNPVAAEKARPLLDHVVNAFFDAKTELPDSYFDAIVMNDVLEHMPDPWASLKVAKNKLAPGGHIVLSLPNFRHIDNLLHILIDQDFLYEGNGIRDNTHLRFFTRKSALRLLEECGFIVESIDGLREQWWSNSILRRLAYHFFSKNLEDTKYIQYAIVARPM